MKTLATQSGKSLSRISSLFLLGASALFLSSCQKDEMPTLTPQMDAQANHSEVSKIAASAYTMITIDHQSAQTQQPSYKLEIKSDGTVLFTGIKNTEVKGEKKFHISREVLTHIRDMFISSNFAKLESQPFTFDLAIVTTTFAADRNTEPSVKIDLNEGAPSKLIELRKATEQLLGISKLIKSKRSTGDEQQVSTTLQYN